MLAGIGLGSGALAVARSAWRAVSGAGDSPADPAAAGQSMPASAPASAESRARARAGNRPELSNLVQHALLQAQASPALTPHGNAVLRALDKDNDGQVSAEELNGALDRLAGRDRKAEEHQAMQAAQTTQAAMPTGHGMVVGAYARHAGPRAIAAGAGVQG